MKPSMRGRWYISDTRCGPMVHARLGIAEENSGKLVALVRQQAKLIAERDNLEYIIVDGFVNDTDSACDVKTCKHCGREYRARDVIPFAHLQLAE